MFFPIDSNNQLLGSAAWLTRAGNWTNSSDERLKKDIEPFASALEKARQLRPVTYRFLQESDDSLKSIGFIAQEVEAIFPSLVSESGDHKGVAYAQFGVIAISAIQELSREVDDLRIKTAELEEELSRMETMERELANLQAAVEMLTGKIYAAGGEE